MEWGVPIGAAVVSNDDVDSVPRRRRAADRRSVEKAVMVLTRFLDLSSLVLPFNLLLQTDHIYLVNVIYGEFCCIRVAYQIN